MDSDGVKTATYTYDTFGRVTVQPGATADTRFLYTCQEYDLTTGLYYYNSRWYDPATGRFVVEDLIGFGGGDENLYRYVGNSPTNATDPSGLAEDPSSLVQKLKQLQEELLERRGEGADRKTISEIQQEIRDTEKRIRQARDAARVADEQKALRQAAHENPEDQYRQIEKARGKARLEDDVVTRRSRDAANLCASGRGGGRCETRGTGREAGRESSGTPVGKGRGEGMQISRKAATKESPGAWLFLRHLLFGATQSRRKAWSVEPRTRCSTPCLAFRRASLSTGRG